MPRKRGFSDLRSRRLGGKDCGGLAFNCQSPKGAFILRNAGVFVQFRLCLPVYFWVPMQLFYNIVYDSGDGDTGS